MNRKSKIIVSVVGITIVLLALLGITYAYYLTRIEGNTNTNSISVTTADLKLVYRDGNGSIVANDIMPGTDIIKEFTVTNEGKSYVDAYVIVLEDIINELTIPGDLTYILECKLENGDSCGTTPLTKREEEPTIEMGPQFPSGVSEKAIFLNGIDKGVTHYYTLTVNYYNAPYDQSDDMGKTFSALINIKDPSQINTTGLKNASYTLAKTILASYGGTNSIEELHKVVNHNYELEYDYERTLTFIYGFEDENCEWNEETEEDECTTEYVMDYSEDVTFIEDYKLNKKTGEVTIGDEITINAAHCFNGSVDCSIYGYLKYDGYYYEIVDSFFEGMEGPSAKKIIAVKDNSAYTFSNDNAGLYLTEDDYGNGYTFRGDITNNYVEFGKYSSDYSTSTSSTKFYEICPFDSDLDGLENVDPYNCSGEYICFDDYEEYVDGDCAEIISNNFDGWDYSIATHRGTIPLANQPIIWRIVRINGDGTIRLIYDGIKYLDTETNKNYIYHEKIEVYQWGENYSNNYIYPNSDIESVVNNWYVNILEENYSSKIADRIFCNDNYPKNIEYWDGEIDRITYGSDSLICKQDSDKLTVENGKLKKPVGLISSYEIKLASLDGYINKIMNKDNRFYWTMSPNYNTMGEMKITYVDAISKTFGTVNAENSNDEFEMDYNEGLTVRPVINLKADVEFTGDGSLDNPYVIKTN